MYVVSKHHIFVWIIKLCILLFHNGVPLALSRWPKHATAPNLTFLLHCWNVHWMIELMGTLSMQVLNVVTGLLDVQHKMSFPRTAATFQRMIVLYSNVVNKPFGMAS